MPSDIFRAFQQLSRGSNRTDVQNALNQIALGGTTIEPPTETGTTPNKIVRSAIVTPNELYFPIGSWKLYLLGERIPATSSTPARTRIPIEVRLRDADAFRELRITVARFQLEADPDHLVPASLVSEPHIKLVPQTSGTVSLHGPGLVVVLTGEDLDFSLETLSVIDGSTSNLPSMRFDPPHFILGRSGYVGIACDEALWDFSATESPGGHPADQTGLYLENLGIYFTDTGPGSWWGSANIRDFFMRVDPLEVSGTFEGELIHHVVESREVELQVRYVDESQQMADATPSGAIPAPTDGNRTRRIHITARPAWGFASARAKWTLPPGIVAEDPSRLGEALILGWATAEPGTHEIAAVISDNGLSPDVSKTKSITIGEPASTSTDPTVILDVAILDQDFAPDYPSNRLHVSMTPGQRARITTRIGGGSASSLEVTLDPGAFAFASGAPTQTITKPSGQNTFAPATWEVTAPSVTAETDGAFVLTVASPAMTRRVRYAVTPAEAPGQRSFDLISYSDWRAEPGIGLALVRLRNGARFEDIQWELGSEPTTAALFADPVWDAKFNGSAPAPTAINLANSAGTVRPYLAEANSLWCLTGTLPPVSGTTQGPLVMVGQGDGSLWLRLAMVNSHFTRDVEKAATAKPVRFFYDSSALQPASGSPGVDGETLADANTAQLDGLAELYKVLHRHRGGIASVRLFGCASFEGPIARNESLANARAASVETTLRTQAASLPAPVRGGLNARAVTDQMIDDVRAAIVAPGTTLVATGLAAQGAVSPGPVASDRMVFALIDPSPVPAAAGAVVRKEFFVTLPGAPVPSSTPAAPSRTSQTQPFDHSWFRSVRALVEMRRNDLERLQVRLEVDSSPTPGTGERTYMFDWRQIP